MTKPVLFGAPITTLAKEECVLLCNTLDEEQLSAIIAQYKRVLQDLQTLSLNKCLQSPLNPTKDTNPHKLNIESPAFVKNLENVDVADLIKAPCTDIHGVWDLLSEGDSLSSEPKDAQNSLDDDPYVFVNQEDVVDGMAYFMARYLFSLPQAKGMTPKELQNALMKAFGISNKGRLKKLWDSSTAFYRAASWGATAVSLYNNPAFVCAAWAAIWKSCRLIRRFM